MADLTGRVLAEFQTENSRIPDAGQISEWRTMRRL